MLQDALKDDCNPDADCVRNCCVNTIIAPMFFVVFVLMAQFVLVNVVVAVLMKHLEVCRSIHHPEPLLVSSSARLESFGLCITPTVNGPLIRYLICLHIMRFVNSHD